METPLIMNDPLSSYTSSDGDAGDCGTFLVLERIADLAAFQLMCEEKGDAYRKQTKVTQAAPTTSTPVADPSPNEMSRLLSLLKRQHEIGEVSTCQRISREYR